jgi:Leucine-rich repeat (LRR) protein
MDGLAKFTKLEVLELYDNMIDELRDLNNESGDGTDGVPGRLLRVLDMSYNVVRDMGPVEFCPNLQELCK